MNDGKWSMSHVKGIIGISLLAGGLASIGVGLYIFAPTLAAIILGAVAVVAGLFTLITTVE